MTLMIFLRHVRESDHRCIRANDMFSDAVTPESFIVLTESVLRVFTYFEIIDNRIYSYKKKEKNTKNIFLKFY